MNQTQLERCLMQGIDISTSLSWIDQQLVTELGNAQSKNPDLFEFDIHEPNLQDCANTWIIPREYQDLDIEQHAKLLCRNSQDLERVEWELTEFRERNLLPVLRAIKYVVDTMRTNSIVWGVGRGSSVSSLTLYLLGVHRVDPIRWNLDPREFFR